MKIHVSKKQDDGSFQLEGRLIDLVRGLREKLEEALGATSGPATT